MRRNTQKHLTTTTFAALACTLSFTAFASAEEVTSQVIELPAFTRMEPNVQYDVDMDGDGETEKLSFLTYTNEGVEGDGALYYSRAVLDFFLDGDPYWSITDEEWSYHWDVSCFDLADGKTYLLASSRSDNDWTNQSLILTKSEDFDHFEILDDLSELTRDSDANPENLLEQWARVSSLHHASGNEFQVEWLLVTMSAGNISVSVPYELESGIVSLKEGPVALTNIKEWTSWTDFDVQVSPEDASIAYHVAPDEKVTITELCSYNNHYYLKCVNSAGQEGWIYDPDDIISGQSDNSDEYLMGYFRETIFAG